MKKCMFFLTDQFSHSFCKDDSSMGFGSLKDTEEGILARESQDPNEEEEDMYSKDVEYSELARFWHSTQK